MLWVAASVAAVTYLWRSMAALVAEPATISCSTLKIRLPSEGAEGLAPLPNTGSTSDASGSHVGGAPSDGRRVKRKLASLASGAGLASLLQRKSALLLLHIQTSMLCGRGSECWTCCVGKLPWKLGFGRVLRRCRLRQAAACHTDLSIPPSRLPPAVHSSRDTAVPLLVLPHSCPHTKLHPAVKRSGTRYKA